MFESLKFKDSLSGVCFYTTGSNAGQKNASKLFNKVEKISPILSMPTSCYWNYCGCYFQQIL